MIETPACRFCSSPAVARFSLSRGCACYPADREQDLCPQHVVRATPIAGFDLVTVYDQGCWAWMKSNGSV